FIGKFRRPHPIGGFRPGLLANFEELVADAVDRILPGGAFPLAVDEFHRVLQATVAVHEFTHAGALGAMRTAVKGAVPGRFLARPHAVLDLCRYRAPDRTVGTDALFEFDRHARLRG